MCLSKCANWERGEWGLYSTVINQRAMDSQSTESVFVRLRVVDFLYSDIKTGFTSMNVSEAFSRKSSRLRA